MSNIDIKLFHSEEVGALFSYKSYDQDTYHHVIVLNCEGEIL